jgi:tRNA nucleotidyltransferase (CCA-adding enzyme)
MQQMVRAGEVKALVAERVWQEFARALTEKAPEAFIKVLRQCGALAVLFPEIDQLFGVPNPPHWHPEIDSGIHTLMVLQQACLLTSDSKTRFAALLHDLGKGATPQLCWPSHAGHEERGVALIKALCKRYRVPADYADLALLVSRFHTHCHRIFEMKPSTIVKTLEQLDAFRRPERFEQFLYACEADPRGRPTFENKPYPQHQQFLKCYEVAANVTIQPLLEKGITGQALGDALHTERVNAIKQLLQ